jgi:DNA-binding CsgD family transcriptional regulator/tetratricopeptide (TPR) repeat protein
MVKGEIIGFVPTMLRGRDGELSRLSAMVDAVVSNRSGVAVVEGMAGIGKSALLEEVARIGDGAGCGVAAGGADELDRISPMGGLLGALRSGQPPVLTPGDLDGLPAADQRLLVLDRLYTILEVEAARRPLVITLDDLQWADDATLLAVGSLPLRLFSVPILWVLARRTSPASAPLETALGRLRDAGATTLRLGPIDEAAVATVVQDLVGSPPARPLATELRRAAGNPFYVAQLIQRLVATSGLEVRNGQAHLVDPDSSVDLAATITSHVASLSDPACRLLEIGSVLGREFLLTTVAELLNQPVGQLVAAVAECQRAQLLSDDGDLLVFNHDLVREAVYQQVPRSVRAALHGDVARLLLAQDATLLEAAPHLALGSRRGDTVAIDTLATVATDLLGRNPTAAADLAHRAFDLVPPGDPRRAAIGGLAADALGRAGRLGEAERLGDAILAEGHVDPATEAMIELAIRRSWAQAAAGPYPRPLPEHLLNSPDLPPALRAGLLGLDAVAAHFDDLAGAADRLSAIRTEAETSGADFAIATARIAQTVVQLYGGHLTDSLDGARTGAIWADEGGEYSLRRRGFPYAVACALYALDRLDEALEAFQAADREASRTGATFLSALNEAVRGQALLAAGRLEDAEAAAQSARQLAEDLRAGPPLGESLRVLGEVAIARGDFVAAAHWAAQLEPLLKNRLASPVAWWMPALLADVDGDSTRAVRVLEPEMERLATGDFRLVVLDSDRFPILMSLLLRADRRSWAGTVISAAERLTVLNPANSMLEGVLAHCRGILEQDRRLLADAVDLLGRSQRPLALAVASEDLGMLCIGVGDRAEGIRALSVAFDISTHCGAERQAGRLRRALRQVGVVKRSATVARPTAGWESLTEAEITVARRVAEGQTSRAVAEQLFVSTNTVNSHLRHVFTKLGVRSRVELVRALLDHDKEMKVMAVRNHQF